MKHYRIHWIESNVAENISDNVCVYVSLSLNLCMNFDYNSPFAIATKTSEWKWIYRFQIRKSISHAWKSNIWRWSFIICAHSVLCIYPNIFCDPPFIHSSLLPFKGSNMRMSPKVFGNQMTSLWSCELVWICGCIFNSINLHVFNFRLDVECWMFE